MSISIVGLDLWFSAKESTGYLNLNGEVRELTSCEARRLKFMRTELDIVFISLDEPINRRLVELA